HQALGRSAMTEAVAQLTKGLEALAKLPEGIAQQQHELDLRLALGPALIATRGWARRRPARPTPERVSFASSWAGSTPLVRSGLGSSRIRTFEASSGSRAR